MIRGIYTAAMGMLLDISKLDAASNNLANVESAGYKKDRLAFRAYHEREIYVLPNKRQPIGTLAYSAVLDHVYPDFSQGTVQYTGNLLDLAIEGEGFFAVERNGEIFYTRAGNFKLDAEGFLVNADGLRVLDINNQPIRFENGYSIDEQGYVRNSLNQPVTRIAVYSFENVRYLRKFGYTLFQPTQESGEPFAAENFRILPGYVELSNVNAVREMVTLIEAQRHFEIAQKAVIVQDELVAKLISQVGTLR
ncbi:flagellar basal-body rod protein FlgF [Pseudothermotoga thermarum]|uniref:Flagellar hook-basal body protein n=1 Tax=Pseudothermotoga thermarum DSM 5069 TaxID=688269 RepID=F7YXE0_9THEM|nr:flagellar basal-body rod protein FlgF [Pseudothermotoga thermarum]AEH51724.1 flagellar hook-basal body protein [Pseudothermotoga thermarum DSM 5069]